MASARPSFIEVENAFNVEMQKVRLEKNISFERLAEAVGTNKSSISDIEKGKKIPNMRLGLAICICLGMEVEDFIAFAYEARKLKLVEELQKQCTLFGVEVPDFVDADSRNYIERTVVKAYQAGIQEGKAQLASEIKERVNEMVEGKEK